ncbi:MAG TPA: hypothetical protein VNH11_31215, partial [Pirellulales bacterium]|nr:hypothetical protein [Pirellulales bacterium]
VTCMFGLLAAGCLGCLMHHRFTRFWHGGRFQFDRNCLAKTAKLELRVDEETFNRLAIRLKTGGVLLDRDT